MAKKTNVAQTKDKEGSGIKPPVKIKFEEDSHKYTSLEGTVEKKWLSCTTFISKFKEKFEDSAEFWAAYKVIQDLLGIPNDEVGKKKFSALMRQNRLNFNNKTLTHLKEVSKNLVSWDRVLERIDSKFEEWDNKRNDACAVGTEFHEYKESESYRTGKIVNSGKVRNVNLENNLLPPSKKVKYSTSLEGLKGAIPELLIFMREVEIDGNVIETYLCGQSDNCFFEQIDRTDYIIDTYVDVDDYKTNEEITYINPYNKTFEYPINHIPLTKFHEIALQMSLYAYMLEKQGYKVRNTGFTHHLIKKEGMTKELNDSIGKEKSEYIATPYLKAEIEAMILFYFTGKTRKETKSLFESLTFNKRKSIKEL